MPVEDYASDALIATEEEILAFRAGAAAATAQNGGLMLPISCGETEVAEWIEKIRAQDAANAAYFKTRQDARAREDAEHMERWEREGSKR
jgi:hypothetical protein